MGAIVGSRPQTARGGGGARPLHPRRRARRDVRPPPRQLPPPLQVRLQGLVRPRHGPAPPPAVRADPGGVPLPRGRRRRHRELAAHAPQRHGPRAEGDLGGFEVADGGGGRNARGIALIVAARCRRSADGGRMERTKRSRQNTYCARLQYLHIE